MSNYCTIKSDEMERFLLSIHPDFKKVNIKGTFEEVYEAPVKDDPEVCIRVYTSISVNYGVSRPKGSDSIRIVLFHREMDRPVGGKIHTKRLKNWRKTMREKLFSINIFKYKCDCGGYLVERKRKLDGKAFYGCSRYPACTKSRNK